MTVDSTELSSDDASTQTPVVKPTILIRYVIAISCIVLGAIAVTVASWIRFGWWVGVCVLGANLLSFGYLLATGDDAE